MQERVKNHASEVARARRLLARLGAQRSTVQIAADTGIHQSQVSRLVRGQFSRLSANVRVLLAYAEKPRRQRSPERKVHAAKESVIRAALRTWDSTSEGARALIRLLRSVQEIRRTRGAS
jgi:hypothetical protein